MPSESHLPYRNRDGSRSNWGKFQQHRAGAKARGIEFKLSFYQWLDIWEASGHFEERGNRKGQYVMARFGDKGAYEPGNVKIITAEQNISEGTKGKGRSRAASRAAAEERKRSVARLALRDILKSIALLPRV